MSETTSPLEQFTTQNSHAWVQYLPEGAVSVDIEGPTLVLRAIDIQVCFWKTMRLV